MGGYHLQSLSIRDLELIEAQEQDPDLVNLKGQYRRLAHKRFKITDRQGLKMVSMINDPQPGRILLPRSLEQEVMEYVHLPYHYGMNYMERELRRMFWLMDMTSKIKEFTRRCEKCLKVKAKKQELPKPVMQTVSNHPWASCHADLIGPMPKVSYDGCVYVHVS